MKRMFVSLLLLFAILSLMIVVLVDWRYHRLVLLFESGEVSGNMVKMSQNDNFMDWVAESKIENVVADNEWNRLIWYNVEDRELRVTNGSAETAWSGYGDAPLHIEQMRLLVSDEKYTSVICRVKYNDEAKYLEYRVGANGHGVHPATSQLFNETDGD